MKEYTLDDIVKITGRSYQSIHTLIKKNADKVTTYTKPSSRTILLDEANAMFFIEYYQLPASVLTDYVRQEETPVEAPNLPVKAVVSDTKESTNEEEEAEIKALQSDIEGFYELVEDLKVAHDKQEQDLAKEIEDLRSQVAAITGELQAANEVKVKLEAELREASSNVHHLTEQLEATKKELEYSREEKRGMFMQSSQLMLMLQEERKENQRLLSAPKKPLLTRIREAFIGKKEEQQPQQPLESKDAPVECDDGNAAS